MHTPCTAVVWRLGSFCALNRDYKPWLRTLSPITGCPCSHPLYMPEGTQDKLGDFPCYDPEKVWRYLLVVAAGRSDEAFQRCASRGQRVWQCCSQ
jgi:hypothetical protein